MKAAFLCFVSFLVVPHYNVATLWHKLFGIPSVVVNVTIEVGTLLQLIIDHLYSLF